MKKTNKKLKNLNRTNERLEKLKEKALKETDLNKRVKYLEEYLNEYEEFWMNFVVTNAETIERFKATIADHEKMNWELVAKLKKYEALEALRNQPPFGGIIRK